MRKAIRLKNGQAIIEASISLVLIFVLLGGIVRIWIWGNRQIVERQLRYNASRVIAGTSEDYNVYQLQWGKRIYTPPELTDDDVIVGAPALNGKR